jgi:DNA-binding NtrC family response regulator
MKLSQDQEDAIQLPVEVAAQLGIVQASIVAFRQHTGTDRVRVLAPHGGFGDIVGTSAPMRALFAAIGEAAPNAATVLVRGESGTGKELIARALHKLSRRAGPFVVLDASVQTRERMRDDLFGHVKGAFTTAVVSREGAFRCADRGTLFIDEIGELPLDLQAHLLRVLESKEVTPVGSDCTHQVDVRVISATHRDLGAMRSRGEFRDDLYYRLSVLQVQAPPLREISEDIPALARHLLSQLSQPCRVSPEAMDVLKRYSWPGNVRELRNALERAAARCGGGEIRTEHVHLDTGDPALWSVEGKPFLRKISEPEPPEMPEPILLEKLELLVIFATLRRNDFNKAKSARELGIAESTLRREIKKIARDFEISESALPRKIEETMRELGMALATLCRKLKELTDEHISKPHRLCS